MIGNTKIIKKIINRLFIFFDGFGGVDKAEKSTKGTEGATFLVFIFVFQFLLTAY